MQTNRIPELVEGLSLLTLPKERQPFDKLRDAEFFAPGVFLRQLISFSAMLIAACTPTAEVPQDARPALWQVADADTTIYLFGTIHILPHDLRWSSAKVDAAIAASDALVVETLLDSDAAKTGAILMQLGQSPGLPPLLDRVAANKRAALRGAVDKSGVPLAVLDGMESWAAALTLAAGAIRELPGSTEHGAETVLKARFARAESRYRGWKRRPSNWPISTRCPKARSEPS